MSVNVCALNVHSSVVASQVIVMHSCCDDDAVVTSCLHNNLFVMLPIALSHSSPLYSTVICRKPNYL